MKESVKLSRIESQLETLSYPISRADAAAQFDDVTVLMADGEANLGRLVADAGSDRFDRAEDLYAELQNSLPIEALGEPGQSEGDA